MNNDENTVLSIIGEATKLPLVNINRSEFLQKTLEKYCSQEEIKNAIESGTFHAGIKKDILDKIANKIITQETIKCTGISFGLGIPGGLALIGTIPADLAQYYAFSIRVIQELTYLYGWPEFDLDNASEESTHYIIILLGVMSGVGIASSALKSISKQLSAQVVKKLPRLALTKGVIYPFVKKIAIQLGKQMTKEIYAQGISKSIPIVSGVISGGLNLALFQPSCRKLKEQLSHDFEENHNGITPPIMP